MSNVSEETLNSFPYQHGLLIGNIRGAIMDVNSITRSIRLDAERPGDVIAHTVRLKDLVGRLEEALAETERARNVRAAKIDENLRELGLMA